MRKFALLVLAFAIIGIQAANAQVRRVTGTVTSATDGATIPGVSVVVKGTSMGTVTNIDGFYQLDVPQSATTLIFSFVGMKTTEVPITGSVINASLGYEMIGVDEVMVVAYGTARKESFTGSAEVVGSEKLARRTVSTLTKAIEGTVAGVQTTSGGGQPGSGSAIRIRGFGSINASSAPLYVVDGVPYDGVISAINPNDIESVTVLKDASASALYGARGANGVVIITTKKGSDGAPVINLKTTFGISSRAFPDYDKVEEAKYMELAFESVKNMLIYQNGMSRTAAANSALTSYMNEFGGERYNPYNMASNQLIDPLTGKINPSATLKWSDRWIDEATRENPMRKEYQLSINGGTDRTRFLMSIGYLDEEGLAKNTQFNRYSGRINIDSDLKEWLKSGMTASFSNTKQNYLTDSGTAYNNIWFSASNMGPIYPVYIRDQNGEFVLDSEGNRQFDYGENRPSASNFNSIATLFEDRRNLKFDNLSGRGFLEFDTDREDLGILKDLKLSLNLGFDYYHGDRLIYNNPFFGDGSSVKGRGYKYNYRTFSYTFNQLLSYDKKFGMHNINVLAGHEFYSMERSTLYAAKQGFAFGGLYELSAAATPTAAESYLDTYLVESYLSRINYDYADKYYLSASFRTDGSSRFHPDMRWGQFWSVGGAWRVSEEPFMSGADFIDNMTLKASYGSQGNDMLLNSDGSDNYYAWQSFYDLGYPNNTNGGVYLTSLENKDLLWEKNNNFNVGIETRMFDTRLTLSVEYFNKLTTDLLLFKPMATSSGFDGYWENVGNMVNKGVDLTVGVRVISTPKFQWNANIMASHLKNEVTKLSTDDQEIVLGSRIIKVGYPINSFYLSKSAGVDPMTGAQLYWIRSKDADGNEIDIVSDSYNQAGSNKYIQGSRIPDVYGSISNDFKLWNFDLAVLTTYSIGGKMLDGVYSNMMAMRSAGNAWHSHMDRAWRQPGDITDVPRLQLGNVNQATDRFLLDASYFAIKNVTFGYNLPKRVSDKLQIHNLRLFATADNVYLFSALKGSDPQYNFSGGQDFAYVPIRTLSLGLDLRF
jgi:TonB-linked SusC/RagA family outer membrane protein